MSDEIEHFMGLARIGRSDDAFHGLLELLESPVPVLREAYLVEADGPMRAFLVEVIWQRREASSIPFLLEALGDPHPETWKQALDGLCALGTVEELQAQMNDSRRLDEERRSWIAEAIECLGDEAKSAPGS